MELRVDGKPVFAATGGRPFSTDRPAVVMIHGAGMDHIVWALQARSLAHRGPDGEAYYRDSEISLGHRRLSVIDLNGGRQPMTVEEFVNRNREAFV